MDPLVVTPHCTLPADELRWTAVRASGPGGQNVNKVSSKVELRFDLAETTALEPQVRARLTAIAGGRVDGRGVLLIVAQDTRDQARNLAHAREKLAELVRRALVPPKPRRATKPSRAAKARRVEAKRRDGEKKRGRAAGWSNGE